ncbi:MAG: murein biosynthesis integral membrane protein MurJ [Burkholderiaceae bacterium]|nr:murein biosynthesis integral membrane protein MurJ [Rhodoferax sp.]MCB2003686.1 murein biosynthesis integral membrane protein MurJ [Rhodoferax sp.]MCP5259913.1 murein biosynthesis integral membrane protein MurJ [Rhodoferax sp.]
MSLFKAASTVSMLTLASRVTGMARDLLMASIFGASAMTDAFNVAFRLPNMFRRLFGEGAFSQAFVPVLGATLGEQGPEATKQLIDRVATALSLVLAVTCLAGVIAAPALVWLLASGLQQNPRSFDAAVVMARWMFPYIGFMSLVALGAGILNTWKRFAVPAFTPVLLNLAMIAAIGLGAPWFSGMGIEPIYALALGVMVGGVLQLGLQAVSLRRLGLLPRIRWNPAAVRQAWADAGTRRIATLMGPALLGVGVAHLSAIINLQIASYLTPGSVSWMSYAERLMEFPTAMLGVALGVVLTPQLVAANAAKDAQRYSDMLDWGLRLVVLLALPCTMALMVFAQPLVATLYARGAFAANDVQQTTLALMGYGAGLIGLIAIKVLAPGFYATQDIRTPVRIAIMVLVFTQLMNIVLVPLFAHAGLTLAISLGALVNASALLWGLIRRGRYTPSPGWTVFVLRVVAATALLSVLLMWSASQVQWVGPSVREVPRMLSLGLIMLVSAALYFGALWGTGLKLREFARR